MINTKGESIVTGVKKMIKVMNKMAICLAISCVLPAILVAQTQESAGEEYQRILNETSRQAGFSIRGTVEKGRISAYSINGNDFYTDENTRMTGRLQVGGSAFIRGLRVENDKFLAKNVIASPAGAAARSRVDTDVEVLDYDHQDQEGDQNSEDLEEALSQ